MLKSHCIGGFIRGVPVPQARPRVAMRDGKAHGYTPARCRNWQQLVAMQATHFAPATPLTGPLGLELKFVLPRPKSVSVKRRPYPCTKPDLDNLIKGVTDALEGLFYSSDSQIVQLVAEKVYESEESRPGVRIILGEMLLERGGS